jgi:hypothetical protein
MFMNLVQRLAHIALGGVLVAIGVAISPLNAERDKFGDIECTSLSIVDPHDSSGLRYVWLGIDESWPFHAGKIAIYDSSSIDPNSIPSISLVGQMSGGGKITMADVHGKKEAIVLDARQPSLDINGRTGECGIELLAGASSGLCLYGKNETIRTSLSIWADYQGGYMVISDKNGNSRQVAPY